MAASMWSLFLMNPSCFDFVKIEALAAIIAILQQAHCRVSISRDSAVHTRVMVQRARGEWPVNPFFETRAFSGMARPGNHNGMLPCFFGGFRSRLLRSIAKVVISFRRVKRGSRIS